ncbi:MAG: hypothetical protein PWQ10_422 [Patescibacteria group bacterium]|nr:hypothetical protein [Patescibacteria group bacterium]
MQNSESLFLHNRNPQLHLSDDIEVVVGYLRINGEAIPNEPVDKISFYLGFLASRDYVNDGILTGDQGSINRQIDSHIINASDMPEKRFIELQNFLAQEWESNDSQAILEMRHQITEVVQSDQRTGLSRWAEHLGDSDNNYPDWFKYYTWSSLVKLGMFDNKKQKFQKRSRGTTAVYPELNQDVLAYLYDILDRTYIKGELMNEVDDEELQRLLKSGNFGKLYTYAFSKAGPYSPETREVTQGSWIRFNQTEDPSTAQRLAGLLQGYDTGWCTAGEGTASVYLRGGDLYVYFTGNKDSNDTIPRIAIRMEQNQVAEARGINAAQELEPEMIDIVIKQLTALPGGDSYFQKIENQKN